MLTNKKPTDIEIKEALRERDNGYIIDINKELTTISIGDVIDLINRLEAELKVCNNALDNSIKLNTNLNKLITSQEHLKAKAYKECIEKLKSIFGEWIDSYKLDDLLKELVGEKNE